MLQWSGALFGLALYPVHVGGESGLVPIARAYINISMIFTVKFLIVRITLMKHMI